MKRITVLKLLGSAFSFGASALIATSAQAAVFSGGGDGTSWEDALNWDSGAVPSSASPQSALVSGSFNVDLDANSWAAFSSNSLLTGGSTGEYRGVNRLLVGDVPGSSTQVVNFDYGDSNIVRMTLASTNVVGGKAGQSSTVNHISGDTRFEASQFIIGNDTDSNGAFNLNGGRVIFQRELGGVSLQVGNNGAGSMNVNGGRFRTRAGVAVGSGGTFSVNGSDPLEVSVGSESTIDGRWTQAAGGVLEIGVDSAGLTSIIIADKGGSGTFATFASGSILDVSFLDLPAAGTWTVMEVVNGDITDNGISLLADTGWSYSVNNDGANGLLTVSYIPEPGSMALVGLGGIIALIGRRRQA